MSADMDPSSEIAVVACHNEEGGGGRVGAILQEALPGATVFVHDND